MPLIWCNLCICFFPFRLFCSIKYSTLSIFSQKTWAASHCECHELRFRPEHPLHLRRNTLVWCFCPAPQQTFFSWINPPCLLCVSSSSLNRVYPTLSRRSSTCSLLPLHIILLMPEPTKNVQPIYLLHVLRTTDVKRQRQNVNLYYVLDEQQITLWHETEKIFTQFRTNKLNICCGVSVQLVRGQNVKHLATSEMDKHELSFI